MNEQPERIEADETDPSPPPISKPDLAASASSTMTSGTVTHSWVSVEGAGQMIGKSHRTIYRMIDRGELESRLTADGRRTVLISMPDTAVATLRGDAGDETLMADVVDSRDIDSDGTSAADTKIDDADIPNTDLMTDTPNSGDAVTSLAAIERTLRDVLLCHQSEALRARSAARLGWGLSAAAGVALAALAVVHVSQHSRDQALLEAQQQSMADLAVRDQGVIESDQAERVRLVDELGDAKMAAGVVRGVQVERAKVGPATRKIQVPIVQTLAGLFEVGR